MQLEIKQNYVEKIRLVSLKLLREMDQDIKVMFNNHAATGKLGSGETIIKTKGFIATGNASLYEEVLVHLNTLQLKFTSELEIDVQEIAKTAQLVFKKEALLRLKKSTVVASSSHLYERVLPDVEAAMEIDLATFLNSLNASVLELKFNASPSLLNKCLWGSEGVLLLIGAFIEGMKFKDPTGNYDAALYILASVVAIIAIGIKFSTKPKPE